MRPLHKYAVEVWDFVKRGCVKSILPPMAEKLNFSELRFQRFCFAKSLKTQLRKKDVPEAFYPPCLTTPLAPMVEECL